MRKGSLSINKVGIIVLGVLTIALVFAATQGWFDSLTQGFIENVEYPTTGN